MSRSLSDSAAGKPGQNPSDEQRIKPRYTMTLRVDARLIRPEERHAVFAGQGLAELDNEALAMSRPRGDLSRSESRDLSASGLRLSLKGLTGVAVGRSLCLELHLPGERRVVKALGDVVWIGLENGEPVAGLRLAALAREGLDRLLTALH
ncbi:MAG: PilZ domain-containing protein [bacterium]